MLLGIFSLLQWPNIEQIISGHTACMWKRQINRRMDTHFLTFLVWYFSYGNFYRFTQYVCSLWFEKRSLLKWHLSTSERFQTRPLTVCFNPCHYCVVMGVIEILSKIRRLKNSTIAVCLILLRNWGALTGKWLSSVTRLGDLLHFGQLFKACGKNYFTQIAHIFS